MRMIKLDGLCLSAFVLASSVCVVAQADPPAASAAPGQIVLRSTPLGPMPTDINQLSITPDGQHIAVEGNSGSPHHLQGRTTGEPFKAPVSDGRWSCHA